ncbi:MAG: hypothetical protein AB1640_14715 [bacterium]
MEASPGNTATRPHAQQTGRVPRNASLALLYAVLVGMLYALPHYWLWRDAGAEWSFPHFNTPDERGAYAGRLRALYEGGPLDAAPQTLACPGAPTDFAKTGEILTYGLARMFGLEIRGCLILAEFLLPVLSILGAYGLLRALGCSARLARLGPLTLYLLDPLLASHGPVVILLEGLARFLGREVVPYWNCSFLFSRLISPEAALPFFTFGGYATVRAWQDGGRFWPVAAGLLSGLAASAHFAVGLPYLLGLAFFAAGTVVTGRVAPGRFVPVFLVAAAVLAPRLLDLRRFFGSPVSEFVTDRHAVATHAWMGWPYLALMLAFTIPFLLLYGRRRDLVFWFLLSILAGGFVCMNLQIVTGLDFGIIHYYGYSFVPVAWLALFVGLARRLHGSQESSRPGACRLRHAWAVELALVLYASANGFAIQRAHYGAESLRWEKPAKRWIQYQTLGPALAWLDEHATPADVVVSSPETADLYTIYSPAKVLAQFMIQTCPVPTEAYLDRFLLPLKTYGLRWSEAEPIAAGMVYDVHMLAETWQSRTWAKPDRPPALQKDEILALMQEHYEALPEGEGLEKLLRKMDVRYIVFGSFERELPGATDAFLRSASYRLCFESKGHRIFERAPDERLVDAGAKPPP